MKTQSKVSSVGLAVPARRSIRVGLVVPNAPPHRPKQDALSTPNGRLRTAVPTFFLAAVVCILAFLPSTTHAKRPDLDAVFWGNLTHNNSTEPLRPAYLGEITVSAWLNGVKVAELALPPSANPNPSRYVLKVPMDDGVAPRITGTARAGERIKIKVRNETLDEEYEVNETESNTGLSLPSTKGTITVQNLSLDQNLGGAAPLMAHFAVWRAERNFQPDILDTQSDADGDGMSNFAEFLADTDPLSNSSNLHIMEVRRAGRVSSIQFGPIKQSRAYSVYSSRTMAPDDWQKVTDITPAANAEFRWHDNIADDGKLFYRVEVKVQ